MEGQGVTFTVSCALEECAERICRAVVDGSVTGECIDRYRAGGPDGRSCLALVFEKHYYRAGNRLTLTALLDDLSGGTRVYLVGGGGILPPWPPKPCAPTGCDRAVSRSGGKEAMAWRSLRPSILPERRRNARAA